MKTSFGAMTGRERLCFVLKYLFMALCVVVALFPIIWVILSSAMSLYYAPVMLVLGLVMGALTSLTLRAILPALGRLGYSTREKR